MKTELTTIEIPPKAAHKYSIIWLHGLGADGHDFEGIVHELHLTGAANIHFIFPNAPVQPVTVNNGMKMRSWYDIMAMTVQHQVDIKGIYESEGLVVQLIQREQDKGIPAKNILLAGFSQGGLVALHTGLRYPQRLGGIIALSTYLSTVEQLKTERSTVNQDIPIFMGHGIIDPVAAIESARASFDALNALGYHIEWHDYMMAHSVCIEEIEHISTFINSIFTGT